MLAGRIGKLVTQFGAMLGEDAGIKRTLNRYARRAVVGIVDSYGETALKLVSDTIRGWDAKRSEEHTSELQSLMRISYAVFCLTKKKTNIETKKDVTQMSE